MSFKLIKDLQIQNDDKERQFEDLNENQIVGERRANLLQVGIRIHPSFYRWSRLRCSVQSHIPYKFLLGLKIPNKGRNRRTS